MGIGRKEPRRGYAGAKESNSRINTAVGHRERRRSRLDLVFISDRTVKPG